MARAESRKNQRFQLWARFALGVCLLTFAPASFAQDAEMPLPRLAPTPGASTAAPLPLSPSGTTPMPDGVLPFTEGEGQAQLELRPTTDEVQPIDGGGENDLDVPIDNLPGGEGALPPSSLAPDAGPPTEVRPGTFTLEARLAADGPALGDGVKWRLFGDIPGPDGRLPLLGEADGGVIYVRLDQGTYYAHAAYGRAGATRKIVVDGPTGGDVVVLNAGGMRLMAMNGPDQALGANDVSFDIYTGEEGAESRLLVTSDAPPGRIVPLASGTYHVVSKYGDANAIVRADVRVDAGKLTEATVYQNAARLTLKLVQQHGGEAIADTAWSVVTPTGERVMESVGAFPSVVLQRGSYTAIARHDNRTFQSNFTVAPGVNRDIEVLAN